MFNITMLSDDFTSVRGKLQYLLCQKSCLLSRNICFICNLFYIRAFLFRIKL